MLVPRPHPHLPSPFTVFPRPLLKPMVLVSSRQMRRSPTPLNRFSSPMFVWPGNPSTLTSFYELVFLSYFFASKRGFYCSLATISLRIPWDIQVLPNIADIPNYKRLDTFSMQCRDQSACLFMFHIGDLMLEFPQLFLLGTNEFLAATRTFLRAVDLLGKMLL